jgi:hypothetical protein
MMMMMRCHELYTVDLVLYGLVIVLAFIVNPFLFFYYEEKEAEGETMGKVRTKIH